MRTWIRWAGLTVLLTAVVLPVSGADGGKTSKKSGEESKTDKKKSTVELDYVTVATFEGTLKQVAPSTHTFTLEIVQRMPDPQAIARLGQLQAQLVQQQARRDFRGAAGTANQIAQQQVTVNKGIETKVDKQFEALEDAKVRISDLPTEFGDKGKLKKYTKAEIAEKKGPGNFWGFPAEFEQLAVGQHVRIMLGVKKSVYEAAKKKKKPTTSKKKGKMEEDLSDLEDPPIVWQIHIFADMASAK